MQIDWPAIWTVFFAGAGVALTLVLAIGALVFLIMKLMFKPVTDKLSWMEQKLNEIAPKIKNETELKSLIQAEIKLHQKECPMKK